MRALSSLAAEDQIADGLLIHIITSKFDSTTQMKWEDEVQLDVIPSWDEMSTFIERRCQIMENLSQLQDLNSEIKPASTNQNSFKKFNNTSRKAVLISYNTKNACTYCKATDHFISNCPNFVTLIPLKRYQEAKQLRFCLNCLRAGHSVKSCRAGRCRVCHCKHHSLLHITDQGIENPTKLMPAPDPNSDVNNIAIQLPNASPYPSTSTALNTYHLTKGDELSTNHNHVFLATAIIQIQGANGSYVNCRALLDSASQLNFISERLCQQLLLRKARADIPISGIGISNTSVKFKTSFTIKSRLNDFSANIEALILPSITSNQPDKNIDIATWKIPKNLKLADPYFNWSQKIGVLIGAGLFFDLLSVGQIRLGEGMPGLQETVLGWIVSGPCRVKPRFPSCYVATTRLADTNEDTSLNSLVRKFWEIESHESLDTKWTPEEIECEDHFLQTYKRSDTGRISVRLPFRENPAVLGDSLEIAKKRFFRLESRLDKLPDLKQQYSSFMKEYLDLKHMAPIDFKDLLKVQSFFLPYHCVLNPTSVSTKLRVVFDGSSKSTSNRSLNDILMTGPVIQQDLFDILLRFRTYRYAITADIK